MKEFSLEEEDWREYDFNGRVYRINNPKKLYVRDGGTTHRVFDGEIIHCVPVPGLNGCVLRWRNKNNDKPVNF